MLALQEARNGASCYLDLARSDCQQGLAQHFVSQRVRLADEDPRSYIKYTLLPCVRAYCALLTSKLPTESDGWTRLPTEARVSLLVLLRWVGAAGFLTEVPLHYCS